MTKISGQQSPPQRAGTHLFFSYSPLLPLPTLPPRLFLFFSHSHAPQLTCAANDAFSLTDSKQTNNISVQRVLQNQVMTITLAQLWVKGGKVALGQPLVQMACKIYNTIAGPKIWGPDQKQQQQHKGVSNLKQIHIISSYGWSKNRIDYILT